MAEYENTLLTQIRIDATKAMSDLNKMSASLNKVQNDIGQINTKTTALVTNVGNLFKGLGALQIGQWALEGVKGVTALAQATADLADKAESLGTSVQQLQEFQYAAIQGGADAEVMVRALDALSVKLGKISEGTSEASKALRSLGVREGDSAVSALNQIADQFSVMTDKSLVAAKAAAIFGDEVGKKMVPVLTQGSQAMADLGDEARKLGYVLDQSVVDASKEFDTNLNRINAILKSVGNTLLTEMVPALNEYSARLIQNVKDLGVWKGAIQTMFENLGVSPALLFDTLTNLNKELVNARNEVDRLTNEAFGDPVELRRWQAEVERLTQKIKDLGGAVNGATQALLPLQHIALPTSQVETVNAKLKDTADKLSKVKTAWESWLDSLKSSGETAAMLPKQVGYLTAQLDKLRLESKEGTAQWDIYFKELKKLSPEFATFVEYVDPVTEAFNKLSDEVADFYSTQSDNQQVLAAVNEKMAELALSANSASKEFEVLAAKRAELEGLLDPVVKAANDVKKSTADAAQASELLIQAYGRGLITMTEFQEKMHGSTQKLAETATFTAESFIKAGESFTAGFVDKFIDGLGQAEFSFGEFLEDLTKMIAKWLTNAVIQKFFTSLVSAYGGTGAGFAKGGAFVDGIQAFASGGILNSPTFFRTNGRLAVAGEAGPEAVVPLKRTSSGDLGVQASPVNIVINNNAAETEVTTSAVDNADGSKQITIFVEQKVKAMFSSGQMDRTMSSSYGLVRQPR
ncbi:hypothetical protein QTH91_05845 [Variovorax dokdonensis]|uniref:Uncharacterized protein n=1 Tax=Variovorax dokdonensis TaxID=344883 RepID=A0ABT7N7S3_9BURK|nr:hypothetical protein [Variovorax dokdonensis]MDM0043996.1 hypothetical protein [Variovorax dokdonensis]